MGVLQNSFNRERLNINRAKAKLKLIRKITSSVRVRVMSSYSATENIEKLNDIDVALDRVLLLNYNESSQPNRDFKLHTLSIASL